MTLGLCTFNSLSSVAAYYFQFLSMNKTVICWKSVIQLSSNFFWWLFFFPPTFLTVTKISQ